METPSLKKLLIALLVFVSCAWRHHPTPKPKTEPTPTTDVKVSPPNRSIYLGLVQSCLLTEQKELWCWGRDSFGNLGLGELGDRLIPTRSVPLDQIQSLAIGAWWSCALRSDGTVWCWGNNASGQLGNGTTTNSLAPVQVKGLSNVAQIVAGESHACALLQHGEVYCWGQTEAALSASDRRPQTSPQEIQLRPAKQIVAGSLHTCALLEDESVWCWGENPLGQLGSKDKKERGPVQIKGLPQVKGIASGGARACVWSTQGKMYCWGVAHIASIYGEKANVSPGGSYFYTEPILVEGIEDISALSVGYYQSCAITKEKTVRCVNASADGKETVVAASNLRDVEEISAGAAVCARLTDNTIWCWGNNAAGTVGVGKRTNWEKPAKIWPRP